MNLSAVGTALIQSFETLRLTSYQDQRGVWTIGWGHTGPDVGPNQTCSYDEATAWFLADTAGACQAVNHTVLVPMNQNEFDALVSFTFNVGAGSEAHSTMLAKLNAGDMAGAAAEFPKWDHVNGVENAGLKRRRLAEQALFLTA